MTHRTNERDLDEPLDLLIVGAGATGLAAALLARQHGLTALAIDARDAPIAHPRARGVRLRATELARIWGLEPGLRERSAPPSAQRFIYCDTLAGDEIARTEPPARSGAVSPVTPLRVPQRFIEQAIEASIAEDPRGARVERGVRLDALEQGDDGVEATVTELASNAVRRIRARFVLGADGVTSTVRRLADIEFPVEHHAYWQSVFWDGDIDRYTSERPAIQYMTLASNGKLLAVTSAGEPNKWVTFVQHAGGAEPPTDLSTDEAVSLTREAVGDAALEVEVLSVATFRVANVVADRYRAGRVFIAGDAAHAFPPTGGMGINTGFGDAHNLVWKLAAVIGGEAPDALLDTYDSERRPVARMNGDWSVANAGVIAEVAAAMLEGDLDEVRRLASRQISHVDPIGNDLGFSYAGVDPSREAAERPTLGARFPHHWLGADEHRRSTVDLLDGRWTLVTWGGATTPDDIEVAVVSLDDAQRSDASGRDDEWRARPGAALVRPDGHIGWLTRNAHIDHDTVDDARHAALWRGLAR